MVDTNKNKKNTLSKYIGLVILVACFLVIPVCFVMAQVTNTNINNTTNTTATADNTNTNSAQNVSYSLDNPTLQEINQALDAKRTAIDELKKKTELYQQNIKIKQQESASLENQLALIDLQVQQTETDIETIKAEMSNINLELEKLDVIIAEKTKTLDYNKEILAEYLRIIYKDDQKTYLEILMTKATFSEFFDHMQYTQDLEGNAEKALVAIKSEKEELDQQKSAKEAKKQELTDLMDKLSTSLTTLDSQKQYKTTLLDDTKNSQSKYEDLLAAAQKEQLAAESDVGSLESKAREQLQQKGVDLNVASTLMWPVSPDKGISAYFHDPTYIFRKYFEHPAIDIPAPQGTAVRAADNGYVVRAKNAGMGYSYIMIVHNNQLSTVYGHISRIDVDEDSYVVRGQQIGLSGGMPGTAGAGRMTTGSHLHFEVRSNGIPVNPLDYLPSL
jgi:murein DD-endopeptidase MepM/ murein hydrolase activator NlpD